MLFALALTMAVPCTTFAQSQKELNKERNEVVKQSKKELNARVSKATRKEAKKLKKEGWLVSTGSAEDSLAPRKIIYQGQVYILRANTLYTPLGDRVSVIK